MGDPWAEVLLAFPSLSRIHLFPAIAHPRSQSSPWSEQRTDPAGLEPQVIPLTTLPTLPSTGPWSLRLLHSPNPQFSLVQTLFVLFLISYVGDVQIDVEVKKYFCKAGVKGMQVGQMSGGAIKGAFALNFLRYGQVGGFKNQGWQSLGRDRRPFLRKGFGSPLLIPATWCLAGDSRATHWRSSYRGGCVDVLYSTPGKGKC